MQLIESLSAYVFAMTETRVADELPSTVRAEFARRAVSHRSAALALGMTQSALSRRMRGEVDFSAAELRSIADFLDVSVGSLLGEAL